MRNPKRHSSIWKYLNDLGILENGTEEEIQKARKKYWSEYARQRMQRTRYGQKRQFSMSYPLDEIAHVRATAKAKGFKTIQKYIRACTRADMLNIAVVPHSESVAEILQTLRLCYSKLDAIKQKESKGLFAFNATYENVEVILQQMEQQIIRHLKEHRSLEQIIRANIEINPNTIELVTSILKDYVHSEKHDTQNKQF